MLHLTRTVNLLMLLVLPATVFAHPGHADNAPVVHALTHSLQYVMVLLAAAVVTAQQVGRLRRTGRARKQSRE
jgi:hypothetical protein